MKIYALYRCLYGEDFVQESINSLTEYVDKIFVFWTNKAWGHSAKCVYKGEEIIFPEKFDSIVDKIKKLNNPKIKIIQQTGSMNPGSVPWNLYTTIINKHILPEYDRPDIIILPEVDQVFRDDQISGALDEFQLRGLVVAKTRQIELWKTFHYRIPERPARIGVVFWNLSKIDILPETRGNGEFPCTEALRHYVHNFGFAISEKVMYWKHMTALAFSSIIGDCQPNEGWYENKWLNWDYESNNKNLEISKGYEHTIPHAVPYNIEELPEQIKKKYNL